MRSFVLAVLATLVALSLSGCRAADPTPRELSHDALAGVWDLESLAAVPTLPEGDRPNLEFSENGQVAGFAGVNRLSTALSLAPDRAAFSSPITTRMAGPPERMQLEFAFTQAIIKTNRLNLRGDELAFFDQQTQLMTMRRGGK